MNLVRDFRIGARRLVAQPMFTFVASATLAIGIGANLTLFSFVDGLLLAPIDAPNAEALVRVQPGDERAGTTVSHPDYVDAREGVASLDLAAYQRSEVEVGTGDGSDMRAADLVSGNYFRVLQLSPLAGRLIAPADDVAELASPVAVLSESYWRAGFGGDLDVVGQTLRLNGATFEVIGVAPEGFVGANRAYPADLWVPVTMQQYVRPRGLLLSQRGWGWLEMIGRLEGGADVTQAEAELVRVADDVNLRFPNAGLSFIVGPATGTSEAERRMLGPVLTIAFAFTVLVFLVTCANLTGVMQARLAARRREMAIRQSLGAGRARLVWEWMAECLLLSAIGGAGGLLVGELTAAGLASMEIPAELTDINLATSTGWAVPAYAAALSLLAGVLYGIVPAWRVSRQPPSGYLKDESSTATGGVRSVRMRRGLVAVQVALSAVLLVAAVLLVTSVQNRQEMSPGFETDTLGLLTIDLTRKRVPDEAQPALVTRALDVVRADRDVVDAASAWRAPLAIGSDSIGFRIPGYEIPDGATFLSIDFTIVGSRYFSTLGVPFVQGQTWDPRVADGTPSVVINETMAQRFWTDGRAVGEPIEIIGQAMATVVGVVRDSAYYDVGEAPLPYVYVPAELNAPSPLVIHVRTAGDTEAVLARLQQSLAAADTRLNAYNVMTFAEMRRVPLFPARLLAFTTVAFGLIAVLLAAVGLNGVVSTSVAQRTREIGVRLALGARPDAVLRSVLREAVVLAALGVVVGSVGGYFAAGALRSFLFGVTEFDALGYSLVAGLLLVLALVSAWVPARRAARIDPVAALRQG